MPRLVQDVARVELVDAKIALAARRATWTRSRLAPVAVLAEVVAALELADCRSA
jgi:hypothetical protein